jgi:hypothetical protein
MFKPRRKFNYRHIQAQPRTMSERAWIAWIIILAGVIVLLATGYLYLVLKTAGL